MLLDPHLLPAYRAALEQAVTKYVDTPESVCDAHRAYIGLRKKHGVLTDEPCIVVTVPQKIDAQMLPPEARIPRALYTSFHGDVMPIPVDVQVAPQAEYSLLFLQGRSTQLEQHRAQAGEEHRRCWSPNVPGGAQIQPNGANWVGTLGCMLLRGGKPIAITNRHVTGNNTGQAMMQPTGINRKPIGFVTEIAQLDYTRTAKNQLDLGVIDCDSNDGSVCVPWQIGVGRLGSKTARATLGKQATKAGRTTGTTKLVCVGLEGVSLVGYGSDGTARFVNLDIYEGVGMLGSDSGDSGSAICEAETNNFMAHLFAGGGGQTLAVPAETVIKYLGAEYYNGPIPQLA